MENELMNYEEEMNPEVETYETESERSGMGTGVAMLIGAGLTVAATAVFKLGKKAIAKFKAKKESEDYVDEHDFVIPSDDEVKNVAK